MQWSNEWKRNQKTLAYKLYLWITAGHAGSLFISKCITLE